MSTERLLQIKKRIETAKTEQAELKGQISSLTKRMEDEFDVKTMEAAEKTLSQMSKDLDKLEAAFAKGLKDLEEAYVWD